MLDLSWQQAALLVLVLAFVVHLIVRRLRRPTIVRRIYEIYDELKVTGDQNPSTQDADVLAKQELLYAEAERLLGQVGIDFGEAVREIQRKHDEQRAACRRLLEINDQFHQLALEPDDMKALEAEEKLYSEAVRLLLQLDMDPKKYLKRWPDDVSRR